MDDLTLPPFALDLIFFLGSAEFAALVTCAVVALRAAGKRRAAAREGDLSPAPSGVSGAETAAAVLESAGVAGVSVVPVAGELADHYDPARRSVRLSPSVFDGRSLASLGVAAHVAGHALQRARALTGHHAIVMAARIGSSVFWLLIAASACFRIYLLLDAAIKILAVNLAVQWLYLGVERDASRRARAVLDAGGLLAPGERETVGRVLDAAAWSHVAATLTWAPACLYRRLRGVRGS